MKEKILEAKNIRSQLEKSYQQNVQGSIREPIKVKMYKGLGLNWRSATLFFLFLMHFSLYYIQA